MNETDNWFSEHLLKMLQQRKGILITISLDNVNIAELPALNWYGERQLNSTFITYNTASKECYYCTASNVLNNLIATHIVNTQDEFISFILAAELNVDLQELINGKQHVLHQDST